MTRVDVFIAIISFIVCCGKVGRINTTGTSVFVGIVPMSTIVVTAIFLNRAFAVTRKVKTTFILANICVKAGTGVFGEEVRGRSVGGRATWRYDLVFFVTGGNCS